MATLKLSNFSLRFLISISLSFLYSIANDFISLNLSEFYQVFLFVVLFFALNQNTHLLIE